jgi:acyl-CoA reductase-like NAD-dependent aldehyde dehydrogenase
MTETATREAGTTFGAKDKLFIGGKWVEPDGKGTLDVVNSATNEVVATIPEGNAEDAKRGVAAAKAAFPGWSQLSADERAGYLEKVQAGLQARMEDLVKTIATEVGMPASAVPLYQLGTPPFCFGYYANLIRTQGAEEQVGNSIIYKEPVGVVAAITPWNYPLHQIALKVAPALAAGCTVVLKPSDVAPLNAFVLAEVIDDAGLPAGVFNLVTGPGTVVGETLASHPDVDMVSFTGSTRAGKRVQELASQTIKRVALELGGKSANVILDDADLETAVTSGVHDVVYRNSGQSCDALSRMLVPRSKLAQAEEIAGRVASAAKVGDPFDPETQVGPLISTTQLERVRGYIRKGKDEGAKLVTGGEESPAGLETGCYVQPTIFSDVKPSMTIAQEEIFGPVVAIIPYDTEEDAIRIANDSIYGLSGAVWSGDPERAKRVARQMRTGRVYINGAQFNVMAPFGGYKQSGLGRELGTFGLDEFLEVKAVQV